MFVMQAEEILDAMTLEDVLAEQDLTEADALALLLENGLVDYPEWFKHREGLNVLRPGDEEEADRN